MSPARGRRILNRGRDDGFDEAYRVAFETPWPRTIRKCTHGKKNYAELDSEPEDDDRSYVPVRNTTRDVRSKKRKHSHEDDDLNVDNLTIDEKSTPVVQEMARPTNAFKSFTVSKHGMLRVPLSKFAQQILRAGKLFKSLPTEIHQLIIGYLPKDHDVAAYGRVCKIASRSITDIIWRQRYALTFDLPDKRTPTEVAKEYKILRGISKKWSCFDEFMIKGRTSIELMEEQRINRPLCLRMMKTLIINSNARKVPDGDGNEVILGLNQEYLRKMITPNDEQNRKDGVQFVDIMDAILNTDVNVFPEKILSSKDQFLTEVIQLCLTTLLLEPDYWVKLQHFDLSQEMVYQSPYNQPLFKGTFMALVNVQLCISTVNFFRFHLKHTGGEGLLAEDYMALEADQLPQSWLGKLETGTQTLGSHWKGAYTYMDQRDLLTLRSKADNRQRHRIFVDNYDPLQDITMFFDESKFAWPQSFENYYETYPYFSLDNPPRSLRSSQVCEVDTQKYPLKSFFGTSRGQRKAHFFGRMHAVPPQEGIPGFQRITFLKFFHEDEVYDPTSIWAYEGCVLPGKRIIVGRWWWIPTDEIAEDDIPSGPFIFWNVDESSADPPIEKAEAMEFLEQMRDYGMGI